MADDARSTGAAAGASDGPLFHDDDFWDDLLDLIECEQVLPVIGQGVTTIAPADALLAPWLAARLAERMQIDPASLPPDASVSDIVAHVLLEQPDGRDVVSRRLNRILSDRDFPGPGKTLELLASIAGLRVFLSATSDSLLARAIDDVRHGGDCKTRVHAYSPSAASKDLPGRRRALPGSTVFHLLGRASPVGDYVVWDEDLLEFILGLNQHMPVMSNLARDLAEPGVQLLMLGLSYSDWLVRLFLRTMRQGPLSGCSRVTYVADHPDPDLTHTTVMLFSSRLRRIQLIPCDPREFVAELASRWHARHPSAGEGVATLPPAEQVAGPRVFISYASEDEAAAFKLGEGLEWHGVSVWLAPRQLKTGMNYEAELEKAVRECPFFLSVISRTTESQHAGYFFKERKWAAVAAQSMPDRVLNEYYHPVIIDDIEPHAVRNEPVVFETMQRVCLPGGQVTPAFGSRLFALVSQRARESTA